MYSLRLTCRAEDVESLTTYLWEMGTGGIQELDDENTTHLIAGFATDALRSDLLSQLAQYSPEWMQADGTDWSEEIRRVWPARAVGTLLFLVTPWNTDPTPEGRTRLVHNPGLACGTGEHPCTQLALLALESHVATGSTVIDVGTGSGLLTIAASCLGAGIAIGVDTDSSALRIARENFELNGIDALLVEGSADCVADAAADITVANISGTVLLSIADELMRITRAGGWLILTGFPDTEANVFLRMFPQAEVSSIGEWRCLSTKLS